MGLAFLSSTLFLAGYLFFHWKVGSVSFGGTGLSRAIYLGTLLTHSVLAVAVLPLALYTFYQAFRGDFEKHKRIARVTLPIWLYVSVSGIAVYWMLYQM